MNYARQADMTISVDGASAAPLERAGAEPYLEMTNGATLLFVNEAQSRVLTGRDDPAQAARVLTAWYPQVVVKLGADGALFANGRPDAIRAPAQVTEQFVDATGSGDAFCAGFLIPWLDKKPPLEALVSGCRLAARARSLVGARPAL
jgi:sugar/nucleoside kinase (ribokinase family)